VSLSPLQELANLPEEAAAQWLAELDDWALRDITRGAWWWTGRPEQQHPDGDWFVWLIMSGRGFGKTRTGAEWIVSRALKHPKDVFGNPTEWLVIGETMTDVMRQCFRGAAGIQRVLEREIGPQDASKHGPVKRWRLLKTPKPSIELAEGQMIYLESADDEDVGRGYNAAGAWLDEYAKWPKPDGAWIEGIMPSLRADLGPVDHPRAVVTTTPKLVMQLVEWEDRSDGTVVVTRGSTYANAANLSATMLAEFQRRYANTRAGLQELQGLLIREVEGALWQLKDIEAHRVRTVPEMRSVVVAMDAAGTGERDEMGLIAAGRGVDDEDYILGDWSKRLAGREAAWRAWEMVIDYGAGWLLVEDNQGKRWLTQVLTDVYREMQKAGKFPPGGAPPIKTITAKVGKRLRAEPVANRYEQGRVHHAARLADLETQQISWVPSETPESPNRVDALVYAVLWNAGMEKLMGKVATPVHARLQTTGLSPLGGR
jgi:phage terminase large subunit-like protein